MAKRVQDERRNLGIRQRAAVLLLRRAVVDVARLRVGRPHPARRGLVLGAPAGFQYTTYARRHRNLAAGGGCLACGDQDGSVARIVPGDFWPLHSVKFVGTHSSFEQHSRDFTNERRRGVQVLCFFVRRDHAFAARFTRQQRNLRRGADDTPFFRQLQNAAKNAQR